MNHMINVTKHFYYDDEDMMDIVITALEGGIGYWACLDNTTPEWENEPDDMSTSEYAWKLLNDCRTLHFLDAEGEDGPWTFNIADLYRGIGDAIKAGDWDGDMDSLDATVADCIFQHGMLGSVVYG